VWYGASNDSSVGMSTTNGVVTALGSGAINGAVTQGPDANVWVGFTVNGKVGVTTPGGTFTDLLFQPGLVPGITTAPDGSIWFTWFNNNSGESLLVRLPRGTPPVPPIPPTPPTPSPIPLEPTFTG
jgi:streptogramin lyase